MQVLNNGGKKRVIKNYYYLPYMVDGCPGGSRGHCCGGGSGGCGGRMEGGRKI